MFEYFGARFSAIPTIQKWRYRSISEFKFSNYTISQKTCLPAVNSFIIFLIKSNRSAKIISGLIKDVTIIAPMLIIGLKGLL